MIMMESIYSFYRINEFPIFGTEKPWGFVNSGEEDPSESEVKAEKDNFPGILSPYALRAVEDAILSTHPEQTYVLSPSASSRIKSMLIAFSPHCVTNNILKHKQLAKPAYQCTV